MSRRGKVVVRQREQNRTDGIFRNHLDYITVTKGAFRGEMIRNTQGQIIEGVKLRI